MTQSVPPRRQTGKDMRLVQGLVQDLELDRHMRLHSHLPFVPDVGKARVLGQTQSYSFQRTHSPICGDGFIRQIPDSKQTTMPGTSHIAEDMCLALSSRTVQQGDSMDPLMPCIRGNQTSHWVWAETQNLQLKYKEHWASEKSVFINGVIEYL